MVTPGAKREAVAHAREHHGVSERRACALVGVSRRVRPAHRSTRFNDFRMFFTCFHIPIFTQSLNANQHSL